MICHHTRVEKSDLGSKVLYVTFFRIEALLPGGNRTLVRLGGRGMTPNACLGKLNPARFLRALPQLYRSNKRLPGEGD